MEVIASRSGKSWTVREDGRELGIITLSRGGRHGHAFYSAWSAVERGARWDLASQVTLDAAVQRIVAFTADPEAFAGRVHRVGVTAIEKRR